MKKLLAMALAVAMVMGLATVSMAVDINPGRVAEILDYGFYRVNDDEDGMVDMRVQPTTEIPYGETMYYPMVTEEYANDGNPEYVQLSHMVRDADAVRSISIKQQWELGKNYIDGSPQIVKKKAIFEDGTTGYGYFLTVKTKSSTSASTADISGTITLKKSSGEYQFDDDISVAVDAEVKYASLGEGDAEYIYETLHTHDFSDIDDEITMDMECGAGYFEIDVTGQGKLVLGADTEFNSDVAAKYPEANLNFFNGSGASFNRTGTLTLYADPGSYLYSLNSDGTVKSVNADYDEYEEAFKITTRTLGSYVISDTKLKTSSGVSTSSSDPEEEVIVVVDPDGNTTSSSTSVPTVVTPSSSSGSSSTVIVKPNPGTGAEA